MKSFFIGFHAVSARLSCPNAIYSSCLKIETSIGHSEHLFFLPNWFSPKAFGCNARHKSLAITGSQRLFARANKREKKRGIFAQKIGSPHTLVPGLWSLCPASCIVHPASFGPLTLQHKRCCCWGRGKKWEKNWQKPRLTMEFSVLCFAFFYGAMKSSGWVGGAVFALGWSGILWSPLGASGLLQHPWICPGTGLKGLRRSVSDRNILKYV